MSGRKEYTETLYILLSEQPIQVVHKVLLDGTAHATHKIARRRCRVVGDACSAAQQRGAIGCGKHG